MLQWLVHQLHFLWLQDFHVTRTGKKLMREQCYGPQDLRLGAFIHVYGRDFFIHDADDFTKHWYSVGLHSLTTTILLISMTLLMTNMMLDADDFRRHWSSLSPHLGTGTDAQTCTFTVLV